MTPASSSSRPQDRLDEISAHAQIAFWDTLGDFSRYPSPQPACPPPSVPSSATVTRVEVSSPQPRSGSISELRVHREVAYAKSPSPSPRDSQPPGEKNNDRALLPSQQRQAAEECMFTGARNLSRRGAIRSKSRASSIETSMLDVDVGIEAAVGSVEVTSSPIPTASDVIVEREERGQQNVEKEAVPVKQNIILNTTEPKLSSRNKWLRKMKALFKKKRGKNHQQ